MAQASAEKKQDLLKVKLVPRCDDVISDYD